MKRRIQQASAALAVVAAVLAVWAFWWEPRRLVVVERQVLVDCWSGPPLRVALLADLHVGSPYITTEKLDRIVAETNAQRPDLVVLLGDFVIQGVKGGTFVTPERIAEGLKGLRAPLGVYAVLGNHDRWLDAARVERAFTNAGIPVLEDRAVRLPRFWLAGISDYMTAPHDARRALSAVTDGAPVLAITHNPDVFPMLPRRICLTLAGHTHGGQVALPLLGRPVVPSHYGEEYAIGHVREGTKHLFVSSGIGTSIIPVRFRVPPEVVMLEVRGGR